MSKVYQPGNRKALHNAALVGNLEEACWLIDSGDDLNRNDEQWGNSPLNLASWEGQLQVARLLIESGADVNNHTHSAGWTPLHCACYREHLEVAELLLQNGASKDIKRTDGSTSLDAVPANRREEFATLLGRF
jgi:ankyrin repeat protein